MRLPHLGSKLIGLCPLALAFFPFKTYADGFYDQAPVAMIQEAKMLGGRTDVTVVGDKGLTIRGTNLEGEGIRRPSLLVARAAELKAEQAIRAKSIAPFTEATDGALTLWESLQDWRTPVGFLQVMRRQSLSTDPQIVAFCDATLARCYDMQGDSDSAVAICSAYAKGPSRDEYSGRCRARYAMGLIKERRFKEAFDIAIEVKTSCPPHDVHRDKEDAYAMAIKLLNMIPPESQPDAGQALNNEEANLLSTVKENPRKYLRLGQLAEQHKEMTKAVEYYTEYRRQFPTEEVALNLGLKIARFQADAGQSAKALEAYESVWTRQPNVLAAATARIEAAALVSKGGRADEGLRILQEGFQTAKTAEVRATLLASLAENHLANRRIDEAASSYLQLMSQYGEQNAAKGAIQHLREVAPKVKNWQPLVQQILAWCTGSSKGRPPFGVQELTPQGLSDLRRLALVFYIQQGDYRNGLSWLQQCGAKCRPEDVNFVVLDEAWFYAEALRQAAKAPAGKIKPTEQPALIDMGLRGWGVAKSSQEGWDSLKATVAFVQATKPRADRVRKLCEELRKLAGTPYADEAAELLITTLEAVGEKKEADKVRQGG